MGGARSKSIASLRAPPARKARAARLAPVARTGSPEDRTIGGSIGARGKFPLKHALRDEDVVQVVKGDKADPEDLKGRFSVTKKNDPDRIADRVKKAKLKT